jgi:CheY-like chemotaxis protein
LSPLPSPVTEERSAPAALRWHRILVAEDNSMASHLLAGRLQQFCDRIDIVANGQEAAAAVAEVLMHGLQFDLILINSLMPALDGLVATQRIRKLGFKGPIIGLIANNTPDDLMVALDAGCDDAVSKSFELDDLIAKMRRHAKPTRSTRTPAKAVPDRHGIE